MRQVREMSDCSAIVVLNPKGKHVATVQWKYPRDGAGNVRCDVWSATEGLTYQGKAGGCGYDKTMAALAGAVIDGHLISDHCGKVNPETMKKAKRLLIQQQNAVKLGVKYPELGQVYNPRAKKIGFRFANWQENIGWTSLYPIPGLERLEAMGYTIIKAI